MDFKKQAKLIESELKDTYDSYIFCGHKGSQGNIMASGSIADQLVLLRDLKDAIHNSLVEETDEDFAKVMMGFLDYKPDKEAHEIPEWLKRKMNNVDEVDDDDAEDEQDDSDDDEDDDDAERKAYEEALRKLADALRNCGAGDFSSRYSGHAVRRKNRG